MNIAYLRMRAMLWWLLPLAALIALIGFETDFGRGIRRMVAPPEPVAAKPVTISLMPEYTIEGGIASHTETINRPLFVPTRRPAPVPVVEVAKPKMVKGQFALTGTTVAGERSLAFLKEVNGGKSRTVKMGDTVNGMTVAEVKSDRVKLTFNDDSEELVLKVIANSKATPQPAAPAPNVAANVPGAMPQPQPVPNNPQAAAAAGQEHSETLAERRRAARAAQAAAAAAAEQNNVAQQTTVAQPPGAPPVGTPPAAPGAAAADTGWAAIYQRYQQRRN